MREINLFLAVVCGVITIAALLLFVARLLHGAFPQPCPQCKRRGLMRVGEVRPRGAKDTHPVQYACSSCRGCFQYTAEDHRWSRIEGEACEALLEELDERA